MGGLLVTQSGGDKAGKPLNKAGDFMVLVPGGRYALSYLDAPNTLTSIKTERGHNARWHLEDAKGGMVKVESFRTGYPDSNVFVRVDPNASKLTGEGLAEFCKAFVFNFGDPGNVLIEAETVPW